MRVKHLKKFLKKYDENYQVVFLDETNNKPYLITKIGILEGVPALILGSENCPNCEKEEEN